MTRIIIKAVPERAAFVRYLRHHLPGAEWCFDQKHSAMDTFLRALAMAGDDPAVHMEEDVQLTEGFSAKLEAAIAQRPDSLINFFSMRKKDLTEGARWDGDFMMAQCWYTPAGYSRELLHDYPKFTETPGASDSATDSYVAWWLRQRREKYWLHVPSLVQHREARSAIDTRRSSKRQSLTFVDPVAEV